MAATPHANLYPENGRIKAMNVLEQLQKTRGLYVDCPSCDQTFLIRQATLFDATQELPPRAAAALAERHTQLTEEIRQIRRERTLLSERAFRAASSGRVGKRLEMVAASLPGLPANPRDCRALADPIDYLAFDGASRGKIEAVHSIEVKSSKTPLSPIQRAIRTTVERGNVALNVANHRLCVEGDAHE